MSLGYVGCFAVCGCYFIDLLLDSMGVCLVVVLVVTCLIIVFVVGFGDCLLLGVF